MEYLRIGKCGKIPALGLGTVGINSVQTYNVAFNLGYRLVDTAEFYGNEKVIGKALNKFPRDEFFIISKVWHKNLLYDNTLKAAKASLKRLNLDYIDLYMVHWPNPHIPINSTIRALEKLVENGDVKYIGVSNFCLEQLKEAMNATKKHEIVANEVKFSAMHRSVENKILPYARANNITIIAYSPLERGRISTPFFEELATKYDCTVSQVALNYLVCRGAIPIPRSRRKDHLIENLGALDWRLSFNDVRKISEYPLSQEDLKRISMPTDENQLRNLSLDVESFKNKDLYTLRC